MKFITFSILGLVLIVGLMFVYNLMSVAIHGTNSDRTEFSSSMNDTKEFIDSSYTFSTKTEYKNGNSLITSLKGDFSLTTLGRVDVVVSNKDFLVASISEKPTNKYDGENRITLLKVKDRYTTPQMEDTFIGKDFFNNQSKLEDNPVVKSLEAEGIKVTKSGYIIKDYHMNLGKHSALGAASFHDTDNGSLLYYRIIMAGKGMVVYNGFIMGGSEKDLSLQEHKDLLLTLARNIHFLND